MSSADLEGVWAYAQKLTMDDRAAVAAGHVTLDGSPALHGTYLRTWYHVFHTDADGTVTVFDDAGNVACFKPGATDNSWSSVADDYEIDQLGGDGRTTKLTPSLTLARYTADDAPTTADGPHPDPNDPSKTVPGALHVRAITPGESVVGQHLEYDPEANKINWTSDAIADEFGLTFRPSQAQTGDPSNQRFGDPFVAQADYSQVDFPYYGFDPRGMDVYSSSGLVSNGTSDTNSGIIPGEGFIAALIFEFPAPDSRDYVRINTLGGAVNLPIGRTGRELDDTSDTEHSVVLSSVSDRMHSWSATLGFSAGIPKMLSVGAKGSMSKKVATHTESKSRYAVSRSIHRTWFSVIDLPSTTLSKAILADLQSLVDRHLQGKDLDWKDFTDTYGTHYVHAMTQGAVKYAETRMSMTSESKARDLKGSLSLNASGVLEGAKAATDADVAAEWSTTLGSTVETTDVDSFSFGATSKNGLGIFFDLRPITELLCPVLLGYNPADPFGSVAPWVWTEVRAGLQRYLDDQGVGQPIDERFETDFTPHVFELTVTNLSIADVDHRWGADPPEDPVGYLSGTLKFDNLAGNPGTTPDVQSELTHVDFNPDKVKVPLHGTTLSTKQLRALVLVRTGHTPTFTLTAKDLYLTPENSSWVKIGDAFAIWNFTQTCAPDFTSDPKHQTIDLSWKVREAGGVNEDYTLHLRVDVTDQGPVTDWKDAG